jgi:hypothetical protein
MSPGLIFDVDYPLTGDIFARHPLHYPISELRNCFAHRGGVADAKAQRSITSIPGLEDIKAGELISLTGPITRDSITEIVRCATEIFTFVDGWIHDNKPKFDALRG